MVLDHTGEVPAGRLATDRGQAMTTFRYGSLFSGVEAAGLAFGPLGWQCEWLSEVDPAACSVLKERYPGVSNLGDVRAIKQAEDVDLIVGGSPCQSFSVNARGCGMDDLRGQLALEYVRIVGALSPRWFVFENVQGILAANHGTAMRRLIESFDRLGYGVAWRTLDSRYFGVAQRRRRVFVVGCLGDWRAPGAVLFEPSTAGEVSGPVPKTRPRNPESDVVGWTGDETPKWMSECTPTLRSGQGGEGVGVARGGRLRRLTPVEWERLMGMPDGYTACAHEGRTLSGRQRIRLVGNSFAVPVVRWIGERIDQWEKLKARSAA